MSTEQRPTEAGLGPEFCRTPRRLILFAHGSADPRWRQPFDELADELKAQLGEDAVRLAYLELTPPTLMDVAGEAVRDHRKRLLVLPFFLATGAHCSEDLPAQVAEALLRFPQLEIEVAAPIGEDPRVRQLLRSIACEYGSA